MCTSIDKNTVRGAYEDVRNDSDDTNWIYIGPDGKTLTVLGKGTSFSEMAEHLDAEMCAFFFVRLIVGDEMSQRAKFGLITWIGNDTKPMRKARVASEKSLVKEVIQSFAVDLTFSELSEFTEEAVADAMRKAGGANYGRG